jgi:Xaa-Pro aminopeptidase
MASDKERERRYGALRKAMAQSGFEALVVCGRGKSLGLVEYVTDVQLVESRCILPLNAPPIVLVAPLIGLSWTKRPMWVEDNRQVVDIGTAMAEALSDLGLGKAPIGIVGLDGVMPVKELRNLEAGLPEAKLSDATELFDKVRVIKSAEEIADLRETSNILRGAFKALEAELYPGATERHVVAAHDQALRELGGFDGYVVVNRPPFDTAGMPTAQPFERKDIVVIYSEQAGPAGYWCELVRSYSFGRPPERVRRFWEMRVEVFQRCMEAMKPGVSSAEILTAMNRAYAGFGYDAAGLISYAAHGIGLDAGEPPYVPGQMLTLEEGMVLSLHPHIKLDDPVEAQTVGGIDIIDNVLVTRNGGERLTDRVDEWVALDT